MPELPEVETITRDLKKCLVGWKIAGVWSDWPRYFRLSGGLEKTRKNLIGRKVISIQRLGKNILFQLSGGYVLAVHLKMTGRFIFTPRGVEGLGSAKESSHIHLIFDIKKGGKKSKLNFSDVRKFGRVIFGKSDEVMARPEIGGLGPDPLEISATDFLGRISKRRGKIKTVLLNQNFLAGVGNIYSDEALYLSKIHPLSRTEKIPKERLKELFLNLVKVLKKSLKLRGTTRQDYRDLKGQKGDYFAHRLVYARKGQKCGCGGIISTVKIGSRTSHFCSGCQKVYK